jgi:ribosomal protein S12 methylthiotransferase accessory factor
VPGRSIQLVRLASGRAVVSCDGRNVPIPTPAGAPFVERVVEGLNRGDSPERIRSGLPTSQHATLSAFLAALDGEVEDRRVAEGSAGSQAWTKTTVLYGVNALSAAAVQALRILGSPRVVVVHDPVLDADTFPGFAGTAGNGHADVTVLHDDADVDLDEGHVVLGTCDYGLADRLHDLARAARARGAVMVPAWLDGFTGHVGPVSGSGHLGCLRCYQLRQLANADRPELTEAFRRHATESTSGRGATGYLDPMMHLMGSLCAQAVRALNGPGSSGSAPGTASDVDLIRFQASARTVLPVPGCPDCGTPVRVEADVRVGDLEVAGDHEGSDRLLASYDELVDKEVGIVKKVTPLPIDEDEPDFVHYLSETCSTDRLGQLPNFTNNGGVGIDSRAAVAKAVGEGVERYCSAFFRYRDLTVCSYEDLPGPGTHPDDYALYTPEQIAKGDLPWRAFTVDAPVCWTTGVSLVTGERVFLPAAMVYVPFHYLRDDQDTPITQPISTGLAAGSSFADAALSGLCEAVERDAFTITWQARLSRPRIEAASLPASSRDRVDRFTRAGLQVEMMDITTDLGVPTILTIAVGDRPTSPAVAVAAATHPLAEVATNKSLEELAHTRKFARQVLDYTPALPVDVEHGHPEITDQKHHLRFYGPQPAKAFAAFAWASDEIRAFEQIQEPRPEARQSQLAAVVARVRAAGLDVIACDLTTPDVAALGLSVVRVVVPGLHPLFMGHRNRALGGRRLYEVPGRLGVEGIAPGQPDNPYPHPFP